LQNLAIVDAVDVKSLARENDIDDADVKVLIDEGQPSHNLAIATFGSDSQRESYIYNTQFVDDAIGPLHEQMALAQRNAE